MTPPYMISFSGGRTSAMMTDILLKELPSDQTIVCFANTGKENEATLEFVNQCNTMWGGQIVMLEYITEKPGFVVKDFNSLSRSGEPFEALIRNKKHLPDPCRRFCTTELKIIPIKKFMLSIGYKEWTNVVGIRHDEQRRINKLKTYDEKERWENWAPLDEMRVTKADVLSYWKNMPFDLQLKDHEGNCDLCFLKGASKIKQILREYPEKADWWAKMESETNATFRKDRPKYKDLLNLVNTQPQLFDFDDGIECTCNID